MADHARSVATKPAIIVAPFDSPRPPRDAAAQARLHALVDALARDAARAAFAKAVAAAGTHRPPS